jgi:bacterioferritin (cytochrome b1)
MNLMSQETLEKLVKAQIKIERSFVTSVEQEIKAVRNVAARLLLLETQKDSEKHALILEGILQVISQKGAKPLWDTLQDSYVDELVVKKNLQNHLETEMAMLEHIEKQTKETNDDGIRLLLEHIAADEKKHHKILETVIKQSYKIKP